MCQFTSLYLCSVCSYTCTSSKSLHTGVPFSYLFNWALFLKSAQQSSQAALCCKRECDVLLWYFWKNWAQEWAAWLVRQTELSTHFLNRLCDMFKPGHPSNSVNISITILTKCHVTCVTCVCGITVREIIILWQGNETNPSQVWCLDCGCISSLETGFDLEGFHEEIWIWHVSIDRAAARWKLKVLLWDIGCYNPSE